MFMMGKIEIEMVGKDDSRIHMKRYIRLYVDANNFTYRTTDE